MGLLTVWTTELSGPSVDDLVGDREGRTVSGVVLHEVHGTLDAARRWIDERIKEYSITLMPGHREVLDQHFDQTLISGCVGSDVGDSFVVQRRVIDTDGGATKIPMK